MPGLQTTEQFSSLTAGTRYYFVVQARRGRQSEPAFCGGRGRGAVDQPAGDHVPRAVYGIAGRRTGGGDIQHADLGRRCTSELELLACLWFAFSDWRNVGAVHGERCRDDLGLLRDDGPGHCTAAGGRAATAGDEPGTAARTAAGRSGRIDIGPRRQVPDGNLPVERQNGCCGEVDDLQLEVVCLLGEGKTSRGEGNHAVQRQRRRADDLYPSIDTFVFSRLKERKSPRATDAAEHRRPFFRSAVRRGRRRGSCRTPGGRLLLEVKIAADFEDQIAGHRLHVGREPRHERVVADDAGHAWNAARVLVDGDHRVAGEQLVGVAAGNPHARRRCSRRCRAGRGATARSAAPRAVSAAAAAARSSRSRELGLPDERDRRPNWPSISVLVSSRTSSISSCGRLCASSTISASTPPSARWRRVSARSSSRRNAVLEVAAPRAEREADRQGTRRTPAASASGWTGGRSSRCARPPLAAPRGPASSCRCRPRRPAP